MNFVEVGGKLINLQYVCAIEGHPKGENKTRVYFMGGEIELDESVDVVKAKIKNKAGVTF